MYGLITALCEIPKFKVKFSLFFYNAKFTKKLVFNQFFDNSFFFWYSMFYNQYAHARCSNQNYDNYDNIHNCLIDK